MLLKERRINNHITLNLGCLKVVYLSLLSIINSKKINYIYRETEKVEKKRTKRYKGQKYLRKYS